MKRKVYLHGALAEKVKLKEVTLVANDVRMLMRGLESASPGFTHHLGRFEQVAFVLKNGDKVKSITEDDLGWRLGDYPEIHIAAAENGAGIEATIALISFTLEISTFAATLVYVAAVVATTYVAGMVMQSLTDAPIANNNEPADQRKSYLYDRPENVTSVGGPIPLVYGRFRVGSTVISTQVDTDKLSVAFDDTITVPEGSTVTGNVLANDVVGSSTTVVTSFKVGSTTRAAGATYTAPGSLWTFTIAANGNYTLTTVDGSGSPLWDPTTATASYTITTDGVEETANINIQITDVEAVPEYIESYGS